jgi:PleD family two-component response regulator
MHPRISLTPRTTAVSFPEPRWNDSNFHAKGGSIGKEDLLKGKRILAVDDEPDVLEILEELLPMCDLVKATTADEAMALFESQTFDIAILDITGVDG